MRFVPVSVRIALALPLLLAVPAAALVRGSSAPLVPAIERAPRASPERRAVAAVAPRLAIPEVVQERAVAVIVDEAPAPGETARAAPVSRQRHALLLERHGPPDPVEPGSCALELALFDRRTGAPLASEVVLWRLNAPANDAWSRGDQAVARARVEEGGTRFEDLSPGDYRAVCMAERAAAPDPPAFRVGGRVTRVRLDLDTPVDRDVRVVLVDERGDPVQRVQVQRRVRWSSPHAVGAREWVQGRERIDPRVHAMGSGGAGGSFGACVTSWHWIEAGPDGFDLGVLPGDPRDRQNSMEVSFRRPEGRCVRVTARASDPSGSYRAVVPGEDVRHFPSAARAASQSTSSGS